MNGRFRAMRRSLALKLPVEVTGTEPIGNRQNEPEPVPVEGRYASLRRGGSVFTNNPYVLSIIAKGYRLCFTSPPPPAQDPMGNKISPGALEDPGNARANIPNASYPPDTPGFYSNVFLVRNASGRWHPVIDLKQLNAHIYTKDFRMHTVSSVLSTVKRGDSHSK